MRRKPVAKISCFCLSFLCKMEMLIIFGHMQESCQSRSLSYTQLQLVHGSNVHSVHTVFGFLSLLSLLIKSIRFLNCRTRDSNLRRQASPRLGVHHYRKQQRHLSAGLGTKSYTFHVGGLNHTTGSDRKDLRRVQCHYPYAVMLEGGSKFYEGSQLDSLL